MEVTSCKKLSALFVSSMDGEWAFADNIEKLIVSDCANLKYILNPKEGGRTHKEMPLKFVFQKMTVLSLHDLPEFRKFYQDEHTLEGPILKRLELYDCGLSDGEEEGQMYQPVYLLNQVCIISSSSDTD